MHVFTAIRLLDPTGPDATGQTWLGSFPELSLLKLSRSRASVAQRLAASFPQPAQAYSNALRLLLSAFKLARQSGKPFAKTHPLLLWSHAVACMLSPSFVDTTTLIPFFLVVI